MFPVWTAGGESTEPSPSSTVVRRKARVAIQIVAAAEAAAALWAPPVAVAVGPTTAAGEAFVRRNWVRISPSVINGVIAARTRAIQLGSRRLRCATPSSLECDVGDKGP
jgi:hypothetical protein